MTVKPFADMHNPTAVFHAGSWWIATMVSGSSYGIQFHEKEYWSEQGTTAMICLVGEEEARIPLSTVNPREAITDQLHADLGDAYDCTRVWYAWSLGTMGENDFKPVNDRLDEIVTGLMTALGLEDIA